MRGRVQKQSAVSLNASYHVTLELSTIEEGHKQLDQEFLENLCEPDTLANLKSTANCLL